MPGEKKIVQIVANKNFLKGETIIWAWPEQIREKSSELVITATGWGHSNILYYMEKHAQHFFVVCCISLTSSLPNQLAVQQLVTALCVNTVTESVPQLPVPCKGLGLQSVNHKKHMRKKIGGSSHHPHCIAWCPAHVLVPDKATRCVFPDASTLPYKGPQGKQTTQHFSHWPGLNRQMENKHGDAWSALSIWTIHRELIWLVVPVTGENRDLENKKISS